MVQIFKPAVDTYARLAMLLLACGVLFLALLGPVSGWSSYQSEVGWTVSQPVPFSHEHHVAGLGIDCRFCHDTMDRRAPSGFPAQYGCITSPSQLRTAVAGMRKTEKTCESGSRG